MRRVRRGSLSSELLMCGGGVRSILLLPLLKIVFFSLGVLTYVVCLCRGCDGCCVFCLYCEAWSNGGLIFHKVIKVI